MLINMKTNDTTIQLRIDNKTKKEAQKTLNEMGLDISSAIKLFLKNVVITKKIPFEVRTVNGFTPEYEAELLREEADALKNGKRFSSVEELMKDLHS